LVRRRRCFWLDAGTFGAAAGSAGTFGAGAGAAAPIVAGAGGIVGANPGLQEEVTELANSLEAELQNILAPLEEEAIEERTDLHHIFPQEFREQFEELGIDIDKYGIRLDQQTEHIPLHVGGKTEEWARTYNDHWAVFLGHQVYCRDVFY
jgi:hypothetical protein